MRKYELVEMGDRETVMDMYTCFTHDRGPSMEPHHEPQGSARNLSIHSQVKEMVQAFLHQHSDPPGYSPMHKPDFVYLL